MKKILITGKDSYIGTSVENYLKRWSDKYDVTVLDVRETARGGYWKDYDFSSYDTVYHVAGIAHSDVSASALSKLLSKVPGKGEKIRVEERKNKKKYYDVNTTLTLNVAKKAKEDGVRQFIFMSSIIVYGDSAPIGREKVIKADTPLAPANFYGDSKKRAEEGLERLRDEKFKVVILRPPMIYGKGSKGNYPTLARLARKVPAFPKVANHRSMLYITNLCEFVRLMIDNEEDGVFFPQNKSYMNTSKMVKSIAAVHHKKVVLVPGTEWTLKLMGCVTPLVNKAFGNLTIDKALSRYKDDYQIVSITDSIRETESG